MKEYSSTELVFNVRDWNNIYDKGEVLVPGQVIYHNVLYIYNGTVPIQRTTV